MSFTELKRQALGSIADGLAGSDPRLASMLTIFSRLAAGEEMPAREKTRARCRRPAAHCPRRARRHPRQGTASPQPPPVRAAGLAAGHAVAVGRHLRRTAPPRWSSTASGPTTCARSMGTACPSPSITRMSARANADAPRAVSMNMNAKGAGRA